MLTAKLLFFLGTVLGPYHMATNFAADLYGPVDDRPTAPAVRGTRARVSIDIWGHAEAWSWPLTFRPPSGYRVRILGVHGDLVAWPRVLPGEPPVKDGAYAGVLFGLQTTAPDGSTRCDFCADNTMLYIQAGLDRRPVRAPFDRRYSPGILLEPDHKLIVKIASWLNTTEYPIHIEPTLTVEYQFEEIR